MLPYVTISFIAPNISVSDSAVSPNSDVATIDNEEGTTVQWPGEPARCSDSSDTFRNTPHLRAVAGHNDLTETRNVQTTHDTIANVHDISYSETHHTVSLHISKQTLTTALTTQLSLSHVTSALVAYERHELFLHPLL